MFLRRFLCLWITISFVSTLIVPPQRLYAQTVLDLPVPGTMVSVSPSFEPALIKGLTVHKDNPFLFDFIVDPGQSKISKEALKDESERMIKYFFAALTIPDKDIWVNLSPYEKDRMIPVSLGQTAMGRDLLAQDYMLKQLTASLIYPQRALGKTFWDKVYTQAKKMYGTTQIPVNTFNKVWIVPQKAGVYEHGQTAFIVSGHLKVMLEEDYLSLSKHNAIGNFTVIPAQAGIQEHALASQIIRQIILPEIEKEINEGKNFSTLRQIFYAQVLAVWFKRNLKQALLNRVYANKGTVKGIDQNDTATNEAIYHQYLKAYKKGVFNYIKEEIDPVTQETLPRKYFSGGYAELENLAMTSEPLSNAAMAKIQENDIDVTTVAAQPKAAAENAAMTTSAKLAAATIGLALVGGVAHHVSTHQPATSSSPQIDQGINFITEAPKETKYGPYITPLLVGDGNKPIMNKVYFLEGRPYVRPGSIITFTFAPGLEGINNVTLQQGPDGTGIVLTVQNGIAKYRVPHIKEIDGKTHYDQWTLESGRVLWKLKGGERGQQWMGYDPLVGIYISPPAGTPLVPSSQQISADNNNDANNKEANGWIKKLASPDKSASRQSYRNLQAMGERALPALIRNVIDHNANIRSRRLSGDLLFYISNILVYQDGARERDSEAVWVLEEFNRNAKTPQERTVAKDFDNLIFDLKRDHLQLNYPLIPHKPADLAMTADEKKFYGGLGSVLLSTVMLATAGTLFGESANSHYTLGLLAGGLAALGAGLPFVVRAWDAVLQKNEDLQAVVAQKEQKERMEALKKEKSEQKIVEDPDILLEKYSPNAIILVLERMLGHLGETKGLLVDNQRMLWLFADDSHYDENRLIQDRIFNLIKLKLGRERKIAFKELREEIIPLIPRILVNGKDVNVIIEWVDKYSRALTQNAAMKAVSDTAALAPTLDARGGIDLSQQDAALHIEKDANGGVKVNVDPALIARIEREGMLEVVPVIINMQPADIKALFG